MTAAKAVALEKWLACYDMVLGVELGRDLYDLPGFTCFSGAVRVNRSATGPGRGQGMAIWVRQGIKQFVHTRLRTDYYMAVQVRIPACRQVTVCCCYFPPQSSGIEWKGQQSRTDAYSQFQTDIRLLQDQGEVLICGDFNAHTGTEDDTGASAQQLLDELGVPSDQTHVSTLAAPTRVNPDRHAVCQFGRCLLNSCAVTGCVMLNGRELIDGSWRHLTTPPPGVMCIQRVDLLSNATVLTVAAVFWITVWFPRDWCQLVKHFSIGDFCDIMSDHAPMSCCIDLPVHTSTVPACGRPACHLLGQQQ